ncbi:MAG TPA: transglutaminase family protein [Pirellulales bacterium]
MKYDVVHATRYVYTDMATLCHNQAHLTPRETAWQKCLISKLEISPPPATLKPWTDAFGNVAMYFTIEQSHRELSVVAKCQVENLERTLPEDLNGLAWEEAVWQIESVEHRAQHDRGVFLCASRWIDNANAVRDYGAKSFPAGRALFEATMELTERIHGEFQFDPSATTISTPPTEILLRRRGVCQDFAHLQIACLRSLGLSARYVSGYLLTRPPPGKPKLVGADASHAWVSVYFPGSGWIDFDPTNRQLANSSYVTLAWGRDYSDVSPIRGVFLGGGAHRMSVSVDVTPSES